MTREEEDKTKMIVRNNYGVACYYITDLLKPHVKNLKLLAPVLPIKKYIDLESNNLDLNTTAKKNIKNLIDSSTYFQSDT